MDVVVVVKHAPPPEWAEQVAGRVAIVYASVDFYPSAAAIEADWDWLRRCDRIVIHCERLRKFFARYAPVEYLDHHIKFAAPMREAYQPRGNLLWVGVRSNLGPLVKWVSAHGSSLPAPLDVLTNLADPGNLPDAGELGFGTEADVRIHHWTAERQVALTAAARAAIDIKGMDFRSSHKPPAEAIDWIASGVPLAMNEATSPVEHLARWGFAVAAPLDVDRWLSREYWEATRRFGQALRELLALRSVALRWRWLIAPLAATAGRVRSAVPQRKRV